MPRVTYIIKIEDCDLTDKLPAFVRQGLPVWVDLGDGTRNFGARQSFALSNLPTYPDAVKEELAKIPAEPEQIPWPWTRTTRQQSHHFCRMSAQIV